MNRSTTISIMRRTTGLVAVALAVAAFGPGATAGAAGAGTTLPTMTAVDPNDALLPATSMPEANDVQDWATVAKRRGRVSNAQPEPLAALGATDRARRDFALPGGEATSVVLSFDDPAEARDAYREVKTWRRHTGDHVPDAGRLLYTGKHTQVEVASGRGTFFSFVFKSDRSADEGTFEWLGVTRRGAALSLVVWRVGGQDATYEVDPTIASVRAANENLAVLG